jgi:probable F420-dependent oxidoreductase
MPLGLLTPVVSLNPRSHGDWERGAQPEDLARVAAAADGAGYHHLTCSHHVAVPAAAEARRGHTYWDPVSTLSWLAAKTERIGLAAHVVVLGYQHPMAVLKSFGTLDLLSGGRVILGVGVGSLTEEFEMLGVDMAGRGDAADEAIRLIRRGWGRSEVSFEGRHHPVSAMVVSPCAPRTTVPIWVGGRTRRSLRRAAELGDGWAPFGLSAAQVSLELARARESGWREPATPFEVVLVAEGLDPLARPAEAAEALEGLAEAGATMVNVRFRHESPARCADQITAMAELASGVRPATSRW